MVNEKKVVRRKSQIYLLRISFIYYASLIIHHLFLRFMIYYWLLFVIRRWRLTDGHRKESGEDEILDLSFTDLIFQNEILKWMINILCCETGPWSTSPSFWYSPYCSTLKSESKHTWKVKVKTKMVVSAKTWIWKCKFLTKIFYWMWQYIYSKKLKF